MCQSSRLQKAAGKLKVVRDGMSILEPEQQNGLSRVTCSTHRNDSLRSLVVVSVVSLGRSMHHVINSKTLRMMRVPSSKSNKQACFPH